MALEILVLSPLYLEKVIYHNKKKIKNQKYQTVRLVQKSNWKIVKTDAKSIPVLA
jgi:hypothetical protein